MTVRRNAPLPRSSRALWLPSIALGLIVGASVVAAAASDSAQQKASTPELMAGIFDAITRLLPASLDPAEFSDPDHLIANLADMELLAKNARELAGHGREADESFAFLSRTLARDAREVHRRYEYGRFDEARFLLYRIVDDCVACHTRLPAKDGLPGAKAFVGSLDPKTLAPAARLRLLLATRRFEEALALVESLVADPEQSPAMLEFQGFLTDYLTTAIRVKGDLGRAANTMRALGARADTPRYLARDVAVWVKALDEHAEVASSKASVERARALLDEGREVNLYPLDHRGLVYFLLASSDLHRLLEQTHAEAKGAKGAEALYLLGVSTSHLELAQWPLEAEFYLAESVREDPGGAFAIDAYELLEERTVAGYTGSSGPHLPADVARDLEELRNLIEAAGE